MQRPARFGVHGRDRAVPPPDRLPAAHQHDRAPVAVTQRRCRSRSAHLLMPGDPMFAAACAAIEDVLPRFAELVRRSPGVTATAVGTWTLPDVACHVSHVIAKNTDALFRRPLPDVELSPGAVGVMTNVMLDADTERDVAALTDRIDALGSAFFELLEDPPTAPITWIGGVQLPPSAVACHLLEELLVHGYDVATAANAKWPIEPAYAALAILGAAAPIVNSKPEAWVRPGYETDIRAGVEFRLRGFDRFALRLDNGLHAEHPPAQPRADFYVSAHPSELLLIMLGRQSHWHAFFRGKV